MRRAGVGRRAGTVTAILALAFLTAPAALRAQDQAPAPTPPADSPDPDGAAGSEAAGDPAPEQVPAAPGYGEPARSDAGEFLAAKRGDVSAGDNFFSPATITIPVGDTVTWTNGGSTEHTVTAASSSFDSGTLAPGASFSHRFAQAGTFAYICQFHAEMKGTVVVESSGSGGAGEGDGGGGGGGARPPGGTSGSAGAPATGGASESAAVESGGGKGLPATGAVELPLALAATVLLAGGAALRLWALRDPRPSVSAGDRARRGRSP